MVVNVKQSPADIKKSYTVFVILMYIGYMGLLKGSFFTTQ